MVFVVVCRFNEDFFFVVFFMLDIILCQFVIVVDVVCCVWWLLVVYVVVVCVCGWGNELCWRIVLMVIEDIVDGYWVGNGLVW